MFFCDPDKKRGVQFFQCRMHHFFCIHETIVKRATKRTLPLWFRNDLTNLYHKFVRFQKPFIFKRKIEKSQENNSRIQQYLVGLTQVKSHVNLAFWRSSKITRRDKDQIMYSSVGNHLCWQWNRCLRWTLRKIYTGLDSPPEELFRNANSVVNDFFPVKHYSNCVK